MKKTPWVVIIISVLMLTTLSSCSDDPETLCYKEVYKKLKKTYTNDSAARQARAQCK